MGKERGSRLQRGDSGKRTIITAAMRRAGAAPQTPVKRPVDSTYIDGEVGIDEDLSELQDAAYEYGTLVVPLVTLPTLPAVYVASGTSDDEAESAEEWGDGYDETEAAPSDEAQFGHGAQDAPRHPSRRRASTQARAIGRQRLSLPSPRLPVRAHVTAQPTGRRESQILVRSDLSRAEQSKRLRSLDVTVVPGGKRATRARSLARGVFVKAADRFALLRAHRVLVVVLTIVTVLSVTVTTAVSTGQVAAFLAGSPWQSLSGSGSVPAPDILDVGHYVSKYGFDWPRDTLPLPDDERQRIVFMLPAAYKAAMVYDQRYHQSIEPELIVWWTHAEGIGARINYSNCANHPPRPGTNYFTNIENCPVANFWQLGYGNQFSVIYVLKNAFTDLYGNPNDTKLVQKVGQWVLDFDQRQGTVPKCGGYTCTFPAKTIDQITAGINQTTGAVTEDNWWASVLSRDPAINSYMVAHALTFFNHNATRNWVGCYYAEPCWGYESNRLGDILSAWPGLRRAAGIQ